MSDHASSTVAQVAQNSVFERLARAGYIVSGLLHLAIGYLAIWIALGSGGGSADQSGALAAVAAKPGGIAAVWVAAVAFLVMALWRLVETALGRSTDPKSQGASSEVLEWVKAFALAVVYFAFAYSTFGFARGAGKSTGAQNSGMSARLMQTGAGTIALIAAASSSSRWAPITSTREPATTFSTISKAAPATWCDDWAPWATSPRAWPSPVPGCWSSSRRVVRSPTKPPDSTEPSKHSGPNPTEQRS